MRTTAQIIETAKQLIAVPSTSDNPAALREVLEVLAGLIATEPNLTIERFNHQGKPSLIAYHGKNRPEKFDLLLNAHLDVVPGRPDQFTPREENGKLIGRGALDMKGTAAVLTTVFCELAAKVPYSLGLQLVTDEEVGGYGGVRHHIDQGIKADFVLMGEYANDHHMIYNAARGLCWAEIKFTGQTAHGGHPWKGTNAAVKATNFAAAVLKRYPTPDQETWTTTASIAHISTPNETFNKVPDSASLKIDFRFTQEDPVFHSHESLKAFIQSLDPNAEIVNLATFEPAVKVDEHNPYVVSLSHALQSITHTKPGFRGRPAASDGRHYALAGTDIVEFGLYGQEPHGDNEYVEIASFDEYYRVMTAFLKQPKITSPAMPVEVVAVEPLALKLLRQLVAMPTVTGQTPANDSALHFTEQFLRSCGMHITRFSHHGASSLLATTTPHNLEPTVLLNAHIDVVPSRPEGFNVTTDGDKLLGRGVMDMKFAIASFLSLVDDLQGQLQDYDFGVLITSDEETGGRNGTNIAVNQRGLRPKVAIVPDGGENWQIETFAKGVQWIKLEATGISSHASRPWEGHSAIHSLLEAIRELEHLIPPTTDRMGTHLSIGTIEGGTAGNQIADHASAMLDIRFGSLEDYEQTFPKIEAACRRHHVTAHLLVGDRPAVNDIKNPYIAAFSNLITEVTGAPATTTYSYGASDGRYFSAHDIPTIIVSPPSGGRHTDKEWLSKAGLEQFNTILRRYIDQVAKHPTAQPPSAIPASSRTV